MDPDRFDPDCWTTENATPPRREAFISLGGGARTCRGDTFGLNLARLALATIAGRWSWFQPAATSSIAPHDARTRVVVAEEP
ncbi:cytochrome P450 [Kibdelosporangium aridum]|uniref:cytochrome P450 n=1 Tax=Kibdelosporangium aridum TaxID=2030 RepID=UPI0035EC717B